jgi:hypothetical protein
MDNYYKRTEFIFTRFDKYLDTVNSKGTLYLAINTFFIGTFLALLTTFSDKFKWTELTVFLIALFLLISFISIFIVLLAVNPFLKSGTKNGIESSILYYGSVSEYDKEVYINRLKDIKDEDLKNDIGNQLYCLAEGLTSKYNKLFWAGRLIAIEFVLLIPIIVLLLINLK